MIKKYIPLLIVILLGVTLVSCDDTTTGPPPLEETGSIFINSDPPGAAIFLDGENTSKVTPDTIPDLSPGSYDITLTLFGYVDTTFTVTVTEDLQTTKFLNLISTLSTSQFGPVRIYETASTGTSMPSGLNLSDGKAYATSGSEGDSVDIYYSTSGTGGQGFLVQSANLAPDLTRETFFNVGGGTSLNDGEDSPIYPLSPPWTNNISDREDNYVFLYDDDSHYSKIKITNFHAGSGIDDPSWVEIEWIYNENNGDTRF